MRSTIAIAALAGSAVAAPGWGNRKNWWPKYHTVLEVETVVHTITVTEGYPAVKPTPIATPSRAFSAPAQFTTIVSEAAEPVQTSSMYVAPPYTPVPEPTPISEAPAPPPTPEAPAPTPTPEAPAPAPTPSPAPAPPANAGYMGVVDEYRQKLGLKVLKLSEKLQSNAHEVVTLSAGEMKHKLLEGTFGQTLAPGGPDDFKHVFVGGWLCELPNMAGLNGECETQSEGWSYAGQTGHAEILTSPNYSMIGCANVDGIWCCDLA